MTSKAMKAPAKCASLVLGTALALTTATGCTLLKPADWTCSDEATPKYEQLMSLVKTWSESDEASIELVADCDTPDGLRFIEATGPTEPLINKLQSICEGQEKPTCTSDGLTFRLIPVQGQEGINDAVLGMLITKE